jgi:hypothetical protein
MVTLIGDSTIADPARGDEHQRSKRWAIAVLDRTSRIKRWTKGPALDGISPQSGSYSI